MYYTTEKSNSESHRKWEKCGAKSLAQAKRIAERKRVYRGTCVAVAITPDGVHFDLVAIKINGEWIDY